MSARERELVRGDAVSLLDLESALRRVIAKSAPAGSVDDLVQDAMVRILAARERLTPESLLAYGIVIARNVLVEDRRRAERRSRLEPRLADTRQPELPDAAAMAADEHSAMRVALGQLPEDDRTALLRHDLDGVDVIDLAAEGGSSAGAVATRLSRSRARLRVEYVIAMRRLRLPTTKCLPVLHALSAGDARRQLRLSADRHLLECTACASVAPALVERRRSLAAWIGVGPLVEAMRASWARLPGRTTTTVTAAGVAAGVVAVLAVAVVLRPEALPAADEAVPVAVPAASLAPASLAPACPELSVDGQPLVAETAASLRANAGQPVHANAVVVADVPADEGFWLTCGSLRLWVELTGSGAESPVRIRPGARLTFTGTLALHGPEYPAGQGVDATEGASELAAHGVHIAVPESSVTVDR